jgi:hypothetical protein
MTLKLRLWPAAKTTGRLTADTLNSEPITLMAEMVVLLCPVLFTTIG